MIKSNFHTHTTFCDGKDTPENVIKTAIDKGLKAIGFTAHSYLEGDSDWTLKADGITKYIKEISALKESYADKIQVFCGVEQDYFSTPYKEKLDFIIGSVHAIEISGKLYSIDLSAKETKRIVDNFFDGDFDGLAKEYYKLLENVIEKTNADVIGHFDLITKFNDALGYRITENYKKYAMQAVEKLVKYNKPFEINTGAMANGYKKEPYPSKEILQIIRSLGGKIMINSDCHDKSLLDFGFESAETLAKEVGFTERAIITKHGVEYIKL